MAEIFSPDANNNVSNGSAGAHQQLHHRLVTQNGAKPLTEPADVDADADVDLKTVSDPEQEVEKAADHDLIEEDAIDYEVYSYKWSEIVWPMVIKLSLIHLLAAHGLYLGLCGRAMPATMVWTFALGAISAFGTTAGVHRLWAHRSYKAAWPLRVILAYLFSMTLQYNIYEWARDHRVHHKYTETNADPHNAHRGFFFSHVGWLMVRKHPDVITAGRRINMDDVWADPIVRFQKRFFVPCLIVTWGVVPTLIPVYLWGEDWYVALSLACAFRAVIVLHYTFMINSVAHMFGTRPFNENIGARDNRKCAHFTMGEGYHNYHHTFPWDYSSAELGFTHINMTTLFIDLFAKIGWAYDRRKAASTVVQARRLKTKDGRLESPLVNSYRLFWFVEWFVCLTLPITLGFVAKYTAEYFRRF